MPLTESMTFRKRSTRDLAWSNLAISTCTTHLSRIPLLHSIELYTCIVNIHLMGKPFLVISGEEHVRKFFSI